MKYAYGPRIDMLLDGREAYLDGLPRLDNPYPVGSLEHEAWSDGWDEAAARIVMSLSATRQSRPFEKVQADRERT